MIMNCPWPLWNRMLISTFYNHFEQDDGSLICLFSCVGNEELKAKHFDDNCKANYVLATQHVGAWIIKPVKNEAGEVTGSSMVYLNSSDAGGNIPGFVQKSEGPSTAVDPVIGTIQWLRKKLSK